MISEIQRVSVFGHCPYSVTFPYITKGANYSDIHKNRVRYNINTTNEATYNKVII